MECGHGGLCVPCAGHLWELPAARRACPLCRRAMTGVVRILRADADPVLTRAGLSLHPGALASAGAVSAFPRPVRAHLASICASSLLRNRCVHPIPSSPGLALRGGLGFYVPIQMWICVSSCRLCALARSLVSSSCRFNSPLTPFHLLIHLLLPTGENHAHARAHSYSSR